MKSVENPWKRNEKNVLYMKQEIVKLKLLSKKNVKVFYYIKVYVSKGGRKYTNDIEAYLQNIETWLFFSN